VYESPPKIKNMPENQFFQSAISVNCVVFGFDGKDLKLLLIERELEPYEGYLSLPGGLVYPREDLHAAASKVLHSITGMNHVYRAQLKAFAATDRHPFGRVITVAYLCLLRYLKADLSESTFAKSTKWYDVANLPPLVFDHDKIMKVGVQRLRENIRSRPMAFELLNEKFTLPELQLLYEKILDKDLDKRNFRRKINYMDFLEDTNEIQKHKMYRPAKLYSFNRERYEDAVSKGYVFSL